MFQYRGLDETIAAISTATTAGAIGIIRLSGKQSLSIAERIFKAKSEKEITQCKNFTVHYGWVIEPKSNVILDEVLLTIMRSPKSYTKEDMVEISCHGGMISLKSILHLVCTLGARLAEPGEFTKRAFLNGRIDLAQAEAVLDIIQSKTEDFLRVSTNQLKGELSAELEKNREILMNVYVEMEAIVNFPEDELGEREKQKLLDDITLVSERVENLLTNSQQGRILKEGIKIVICGQPNVGKSSLLNCLLRTPRAIVSDIAGTTRDTIEEYAHIGGIPFQLVDTAGILDPRDVIEEEAVKRSRMNIENAELILFVLDSSRTINEEDKKLSEQIKNRQVIIVLNKCDLPSQIFKEEMNDILPGKECIPISALQKSGIDQLEKAITHLVFQGKPVDTHNILISNLRHIQALRECLAHLQKANETFITNLSLEFVSEEIKLAVYYLDSITGKDIDQDLLDNIFSQFCIGK
jgi:tRNA modification GTPase